MPYKDVEDKRANVRNRKHKNRALFFAGKCCVKCGSNFSLELDHIDPKLKVSHSIWEWRKDRRDTELAKCQVLCRDCHRIKSNIDISLPGELNYNSKLTSNEVREIKAIGRSQSQIKIAATYGVHRSLISLILNGKAWVHVK